MGALSGLGFERDSKIEKAIDRKSVLHGISAESIVAYMDVLEELLEDYYARDEFRTRNAIGGFIRWENIPLASGLRVCFLRRNVTTGSGSRWFTLT